MTDGFDDRQVDDPPGGVGGAEDVAGKEDVGEKKAEGGEDGDDGAGDERAGTDPEGDDPGPGVDEDEYEPSLAGVFGGRPEDEPPRKELVPESPSLENALFLLLGVLLGGFVVYRAVTVFTA